jgi:hypothetical protein
MVPNYTADRELAKGRIRDVTGGHRDRRTHCSWLAKRASEKIFACLRGNPLPINVGETRAVQSPSTIRGYLSF